jgi:lipopolysaccharide transport system ATP-binding protein
MSDSAIKVEGLSKRYRIGANFRVDKTLREKLNETALAPFRAMKSLAQTRGNEQNAGRGKETFWALKDVSFEVKRGEVIGIIGRNGAGKSTLLKILSRITDPTEGFAEIQGRLASLLEVGTGFQPELSGRENIFLNGSILGMKHAEIRRKFDEIVAFAEVEKFIDTPVKHYSSGMYVRLAFAVAAHLDPEILLVDEVLAVGDLAFQKKCLGKIGDISAEGRTVLFVSHSMQAIARLCKRAILLDAGRIAHDGPTHQVVTSYLGSGLGNIATRRWTEINAPGNDIVRLRAVNVLTDEKQVTAAIDIRKAIDIEMEYEVLKSGHVLVPNFHFYNEEGTCAFILAEFHNEWHRKPKAAGRYKSTVQIPGNFLAEGSLMVSAAISTYTPFYVHLHEQDAVVINIVDSLDGNSTRGDYAGHYPGVVRPMMQWKTEFEHSRQLVNA